MFLKMQNQLAYQKSKNQISKDFNYRKWFMSIVLIQLANIKYLHVPGTVLCSRHQGYDHNFSTLIPHCKKKKNYLSNKLQKH